MSRDYKPTQKRSSNSGSKGSPFLTGLLVGVLIGVGISVAVALLVKKSDSPFVAKVTPGAVTEAPTTPDALPKDEKNADGDSKPRFDFYTILPGNESKVTEQDIKPDVAQTQVNETYFLQAGAFQTEQEADNMKAQLALLGMEAIVQTATIPDKGVWHRVRVGPFSNVDQINKVRAELTKNGFATDLIKVNSTTPNQ